MIFWALSKAHKKLSASKYYLYYNIIMITYVHLNFRFQEKKVDLVGVVKWLQSRKNSSNDEGPLQVATANDTNQPQVHANPGVNAGINFHFETTEKLAHNTRRRYENQVCIINSPIFFKLIGLMF